VAIPTRPDPASGPADAPEGLRYRLATPSGRHDGANKAHADTRVHAAGVPTAWLRALVLPLIVLTWLVVAILGVWVLSHFTRTILIVVLATILAFAFTPLANLLGRRMPRALAIGLAYILGLALVVGFGAYVVATSAEQVSTLIANLPGYTQQAQALQPQIDDLLTPFGLPPGWSSELQSQAIGQVQASAGAVAADVFPQVAAFFGTIIDIILTLILSVYLCANGARIAQWLKTETPDGTTQTRARLLVSIVNRVVGGYIRGVLLLALLIGVLVGAGMAILGVPYAVLLGVLAFFMEFIPVLGVFISGAAAVLLAIVNYRDVIHPLIVLAYFIVVHILEGDVIGPRIMGRAVGIHPATGLIALVAGTEVFGIWGALFAAPLAGLLQSVVVALWIEFRGGDPQTVLEAAESETAEAVEHQAGVAD
jgi:predicted PurR-regulated permease PerM